MIIAHSNIEQLKKLIKLLDYKFNDIYVHIDKKLKDINIDLLKNIVKFSKIEIYHEIDVKWGGYSQIEVELFLLKKAVNNNYMYYHLLSGLDLPIKSQKFIHNYFKKNNGYEFIDFDNNAAQEQIKERIKYYYFFTDYKRKSNKLQYYFQKCLLFTFLKLQKIINVKRCSEKQIYKKGSNWFSITHDCVLFVINNENIIHKIYKYGNCVDEIFLQTLIYNSNLYQNVYKIEEKFNLAMRYIDWEHGNPYVFKKEDFQRLINSNALFARKFDENVDKRIIDMICEIKNE